MTSFNMPPGCNVSDIPGWDEPPLYPDVRCSACGCFIALHGVGSLGKNYSHTVEHTHVYKCPGFTRLSDNWPNCDNDQPHGEHKFHAYDGQTIYYKCAHCGNLEGVTEF
jgi:hypothetical protein